VNTGQHCWKACWGQPLASSNLASSATLTCKNPVLAASKQVPRAPVGSFAGLIYELWAVPPPGSAELLSLVTGVAEEPERRGARRRSVLGGDPSRVRSHPRVHSSEPWLLVLCSAGKAMDSVAVAR
jgi:hypothetical protein